MPNEESKTGLTAAELSEGELYGVLTQARGETKPLPAHYVFGKIRAAEDHVEAVLSIFLGEQRIVSEGEKRAGTASAVVGSWDVSEPAYDWLPQHHGENVWGLVQLSHRPIKEIDRAFFSYPGMNFQSSLDLATSWRRKQFLDTGFEVVPMSGPAGLLAWQMSGPVHSIVSGGHRVPGLVFVDYTAGVPKESLRLKHANLLEAVRIYATLLLFPTLTNVRAGGAASLSLSLDGLSRSTSFGGGKFGAYSGVIEQYREIAVDLLRTWRDRNHGVRMVIV
jgi:hypothetical protein